jgi:tetratricopeptide (TPR) repeat protein
MDVGSGTMHYQDQGQKNMTSMQLSSCFVLLTLFSPAAAFAQGPDAWDREAGQKEIDGMRRYAWALSNGTAGALKQMPAEEFAAVHAFLKDFDAAHKDIDPQNAPSEWKMIDVEKLAIRNPKYWAAIYELEPAAPVTMWFHASLYAVNGEVAPTLYSQLLAVRSPTDKPKEMSRLIVSSSRLITMGDKAVQVGVKLHDQEEYDKAEKIFCDVLSVIPSHSLALYELGNTLRKKDRSKAGTAAAQANFDHAKRADPFRVEAYQGSFRGDEMRQFVALRTQARPAWDKLVQSSPNQDSVEQLVGLSSHLQNAGLHELGLLVRQLVVAHREASYNEDDLEFIKASLEALMPGEDFEAILKRLQQR